MSHLSSGNVHSVSNSNANNSHSQSNHYDNRFKMRWTLTDCTIDAAHSIDLDASDAYANHPNTPPQPSQPNQNDSDSDSDCDCDEMNSIHCGDIALTLMQYAQHSDYRIYSRIVMHGFIRDLEAHIASIVPTDIIKMCSSFYFEEANDSIHAAYTLYQQIAAKPVGGERVLSLIKKYLDCKKCAKKKTHLQILGDLVQFKFMRIVSRKSSFSQLVRCMNANAPLHSALCTYTFVDDVSKAFSGLNNHI